MNITYQLSENEYHLAVALHNKRSKKIVILVIYIILAAVIVVVGTDFSNTREIITNIITAFFAISFYILFVRMSTMYQVKNIYNKSTILKDEINMRISGKGIQVDKNANNRLIPWSQFTEYKKDDNYCILYTSPNQFNVIPLRVMDDAQKDELNGYLEKYLKNKPSD